MSTKKVTETYSLKEGHKVVKTTTTTIDGVTVSKANQYVGSTKKLPALKALVTPKTMAPKTVAPAPRKATPAIKAKPKPLIKTAPAPVAPPVVKE